MSNLTIKYKTERARITKVALKYKYSARVSITQQSNKNTACFITNVTMKYRYSVQFFTNVTIKHQHSLLYC